jgi:hypothetical protein
MNFIFLCWYPNGFRNRYLKRHRLSYSGRCPSHQVLEPGFESVMKCTRVGNRQPWTPYQKVNVLVFYSSVKMCVIGAERNVEGARYMGTVMGAQNAGAK